LTERRDIGSRLENWARLFPQPGAGEQPDRRAFDPTDAAHLERAMQALPTLQRSLLWWCYVKQDTPEKVARRLGISMRPALHFVDAFRHAQAAAHALAESATLPQEG
jgi:DNA-directed RNA polymerase specialized sigma24 family protein